MNLEEKAAKEQSLLNDPNYPYPLTYRLSIALEELEKD